MVFNFSTKGGTLSALYGHISSARILPLFLFTVQDWRQSRESCIAKVVEQVGEGPYVVRSSCRAEDQANFSNAGVFSSYIDVNIESLESAIEAVISSYDQVSNFDEVLVQPALTNVIRSGVAFSHDPNTCAPYRLINWSDSSDTQVVTGGMGGRMWQSAANSTVSAPFFLVPIINLINELLNLFGGAPLDCEFAVTCDQGMEIIWLLQVRPLLLRESPENADVQFERLKNIEDKVRRGMQPHPFLCGKRTIYGVMPDWNPAEIIGIRPKPLALSLYRELITDAVWAYQRHNYGYRNLRSFPLMPHFYGQPYIDVRLSFNSFVPDDLDEKIAEKLVDYYIDRLEDETSLHDKVEFEIVLSCYSLDLPKSLNSLRDFGFTKSECEEISESLRRLTNRIVHAKNGLWRSDAAKLETLIDRRQKLLNSSADKLERIYWLLEDGKRYGTLPFAGLARAGFVAVRILKSLVAVGVFSQADYDTFITSVSTVSSKLSHDRYTLTKFDLLEYYGHLRPGTYDILSYRYDEAPELYFDWSMPHLSSREVRQDFSITSKQIDSIANLLKFHGLEIDPLELISFMRAAIELRELAKFHFSRNLSDVLKLIAEVGDQYGFDRDALAYSNIDVFKELHVASVKSKDLISGSIADGMRKYAETSKLSLPPLIVKPEDIWSFEWPETAPNFITQQSVTGFVVGCDAKEKLAGSIVCIPSADPGFDWLFSYPIAGLITAWGGANSHMAIRAGELGLPAVIGAGELLYQRWSAAQQLHIDCAARRVEVLV